jgi:hypothetical protein
VHELLWKNLAIIIIIIILNLFWLISYQVAVFDKSRYQQENKAIYPSTLLSSSPSSSSSSYSVKTTSTPDPHIRTFTLYPLTCMYSLDITVFSQNTVSYKIHKSSHFIVVQSACLPISLSAQHEVLSTVLFTVQVFWDVALCYWASSCRRFEGFYCVFLQGQAVISQNTWITSHWGLACTRKWMYFSSSLFEDAVKCTL